MDSIFVKNGSETPEPVRATVSGESGLGAPSGVQGGFGARFRGSQPCSGGGGGGGEVRGAAALRGRMQTCRPAVLN